MNNVKTSATSSQLVARIQRTSPTGRHTFFAFDDLFEFLGIKHSINKDKIIAKTRDQLVQEGIDARKVFTHDVLGICAPMSVLPIALYRVDPVMLGDRGRCQTLALVKADLGVEEIHSRSLKLVEAESFSPFADEPEAVPESWSATVNSQPVQLQVITNEVIHTPPVDNSLQALSYLGKEVRMVMKDGEPWWVAKDVCEILGIAKANDATRNLDEDEKGTDSIRTPSGDQEMLIVNEPGLYSLILRSRKPEAKAFKRWVTHEVLPSIRKTGSYSVQPANPSPALPTDYKSALVALLQEVEKTEAQSAVIRELAPKAEFHDAVTQADGEHDLVEAAKVLGIGRTRLIEVLKEKGIFFKHDPLPYQKYIDSGYFRVCETPYEGTDGKTRVRAKTVVTGKGMTWLQKRLGNNDVTLVTM